MGGSSSRLGSRPSRTQMDDHTVEPRGCSNENLDPTISKVCKGREVSSSAGRVGIRGGISTGENGTSSVNNLGLCNIAVEEGAGCIPTIFERKNLSESKELIPPPRVSADNSHDESSRDNRAAISSSFVGPQSSPSVSMNTFANESVVNGIDNSVDKSVSQTILEDIRPRSSQIQWIGNSSSGNSSAENHIGEGLEVQISDSDSARQVLDSPITSHILGNESFEETPPSGSGFLMCDRGRGQRDGGALHVDVVTISTNILPISEIDSSSNERSSRRLFLDTYSRHNSSRPDDSPYGVFSASDNDHGSRDRWLLDLTGDLSSVGVGGGSERLGSRIHGLNERRRHSRSEIWERLRGGLDEINRWNNSCPIGLHPDGDCACRVNPVTDESSTRANISRIVMLAEALFEMLHLPGGV